MEKSKPVVALFGANGNLGSRLLRNSSSENYLLVPVTRSGFSNHDFFLTSKNEIIHDCGIVPDLIVNLSNYYSPIESSENIKLMQDAIIGTKNIINKHVENFGIDVISASTYFQYAPEEFRPWSAYADMKSQAQEEFINSSKKNSNQFTDFVMFDNYGGKSRGKFLDRVVESIRTGEEVAATGGEQLINLTHLDDISLAFQNEINRMLNGSESAQNVHLLKSSYTRTLKKVVEDIQKITNQRANIGWGKIPYREREVLFEWVINLSPPPEWFPKIDFFSWIKETI